MQVIRSKGGIGAAAKSVLAEGLQLGVDGFVVGIPVSDGGELSRRSTDSAQV